MKRCPLTIFFGVFLVLFSLSAVGNPVQAQPPVVHAVLFYYQSCAHCHKVIMEDLTPMVEQYGEQLTILAIDTVTRQGVEMFQATADYYQIPEEARGVPMLIVGDVILIGSAEIPQKFPGIVEQGLADGGIAWPDFPGLAELLAAQGLIAAESSSDVPSPSAQPPVESPVASIPATAVAEAESVRTPTELSITTDLAETKDQTLAQRFAQDKAGNTLSVLVLLGTVGLLLWVVRMVTYPTPDVVIRPRWVVPVLVGVGTAVALYMGYVEISQTEAVCGPVGHCNTVQQSPYAALFGWLPIGVLGVIGYLLIGVVWLFTAYGPIRWRWTSAVALWLLALGGTLFSLYLTFLEPFVIGASCVWCLTSAVVMALLLWSATGPVVQTRGAGWGSANHH